MLHLHLHHTIERLPRATHLGAQTLRLAATRHTVSRTVLRSPSWLHQEFTAFLASPLVCTTLCCQQLGKIPAKALHTLLQIDQCQKPAATNSFLGRRYHARAAYRACLALGLHLLITYRPADCVLHGADHLQGSMHRHGVIVLQLQLSSLRLQR